MADSTKPSTTIANTNATPSSSSSAITLPPSFSPDALDALTSLAHDLTRVRAGLLQATEQVGTGGAAGVSDGKQPLAIKDVPGATDAIKHKIQRARVTIVGLPDMKRGIEDQEREIRELEERIERQRRELRGLREKGERGGDRMEL